jgi:hypothetical protein
MLKLFDTVALLKAHPEFGLVRGQVGSVVEIHRGGEAYEVEFSDQQGETSALAAFKAADLLRLVHAGDAVA